MRSKRCPTGSGSQSRPQPTQGNCFRNTTSLRQGRSRREAERLPESRMQYFCAHSPPRAGKLFDLHPACGWALACMTINQVLRFPLIFCWETSFPTGKLAETKDGRNNYSKSKCILLFSPFPQHLYNFCVFIHRERERPA